MPNWNSRLAVAVEVGESGFDVTPIDSFNPSFSLNAEPLHSIEKTHIGVVSTPQSVTFTITVKAIGEPAAKLTALALNGSRFSVILQEMDGGDDWSFTKIVLTECVITSAVPTNATISGPPVATFSGFSLSASSEDKVGTTVGTP